MCCFNFKLDVICRLDNHCTALNIQHTIVSYHKYVFKVEVGNSQGLYHDEQTQNCFTQEKSYL